VASASAISPVCSAALAKLKAHAGVLAWAPTEKIADEFVTRPAGQYILVESAGERPFNTMGGTPNALKWGAVAGLRIRIVSQYRGDAAVSDGLSAVKACLDGQDLTVTGFPTVSVDFVTANMLKETINGVTTRELVADFDVTVHQS
jgi:hypothetical protein